MDAFSTAPWGPHEAPPAHRPQGSHEAPSAPGGRWGRRRGRWGPPTSGQVFAFFPTTLLRWLTSALLAGAEICRRTLINDISVPARSVEVSHRRSSQLRNFDEIAGQNGSTLEFGQTELDPKSYMIMPQLIESISRDGERLQGWVRRR